jgi:hypothetical protein
MEPVTLTQDALIELVSEAAAKGITAGVNDSFSAVESFLQTYKRNLSRTSTSNGGTVEALAVLNSLQTVNAILTQLDTIKKNVLTQVVR